MMLTEITTTYRPVKVVQILCRCPQCKGENKLVINWINPRRYSKCQACGELIPTDGYKIVMLNYEPGNSIF